MTPIPPLPRSAPEAQGISSSAIDAFLEAAQGIRGLHSFMLLLAERLQHLAIQPPAAGETPAASRFSGKTYAFDKNDESLRALSFDFAANTLTYRLLGGGQRRGAHTLPFGRGTWVETTTLFGATVPAPVAASGAWTADDTFTLTLCYFETPFIVSLACQFAGDELRLDYKVNASFGPTERPRLAGKS